MGAALARAMRGQGAALLAGARAPAAGTTSAFDSRVYALSPANVAFMREIGAWQAISPSRLAPVYSMRIFGDDGASGLELDAYRAGLPELAWIVEDTALQDALWRDQQPPLQGEPERLEFDADQAQVVLRDGRSLATRLVIGADGARSVVRSAAGISAAERDYGQLAVVANFRCDKPHRDTAYQWFQGGPVLALLPLPGRQVSMVWSLPSAAAERVLRLEAHALCREVEAASRGALGALELAGAPRSFPLRHLAARRMVGPRVALAGDAGHVIHPLAGQGLNLGLQDARALAEVLAHRRPGSDPGALRLLRRYERGRAEPLLAMNIAVDGLFALFGGGGETLTHLRNSGLNLTDRVPVLKNAMIRHAVG